MWWRGEVRGESEMREGGERMVRVLGRGEDVRGEGEVKGRGNNNQQKQLLVQARTQKRNYVPFASDVRATQIRFNFNGQPTLKQCNDHFKYQRSILHTRSHRGTSTCSKARHGSLTWYSLSSESFYVSHSRCHVQKSFGHRSKQ